MNIKKAPGRPAKGFGERKDIRIMVRLDIHDETMLYNLRQKLGKSNGEIIRMAIRKLFNEEARK